MQLLPSDPRSLVIKVFYLAQSVARFVEIKGADNKSAIKLHFEQYKKQIARDRGV